MISSERDTPISPELVSSMSLQDALRALGLEHAAASLETAQQKAIARNASPLSLLDHLIRDELRSQIEQIDRALVTKAATLDFVREKANVVFVGPSGVGKTHLANALGQLACLRGFRVRFVLAADLVNDLVAGQTRNTLNRRLATWAAPDLLLIDELGYHAANDAPASLTRRRARSSPSSPIASYAVASPRILTIASTQVTSHVSGSRFSTMKHPPPTAVSARPSALHASSMETLGRRPRAAASATPRTPTSLVERYSSAPVCRLSAIGC